MTQCLIIDDDPTSRFVTSKMVQHCGFSVKKVKNAKAALKICKHHMPDHIIVD